MPLITEGSEPDRLVGMRVRMRTSAESVIVVVPAVDVHRQMVGERPISVAPRAPASMSG
jgi:hypothetical protein